MNNENSKGNVIQIIGSVVDVEFPPGHLPLIDIALRIKRDIPDDQGRMEVIAEVQQHLGDNVVRCISLSPTDGLRRGNEAINTLQPITVPVGRQNLGRMFNVLGEPIDGLGPVTATQFLPIHRAPPSLQIGRAHV